jgi:zinc D-Ala-D-Ala carboxypeptidase
MPGFLFSLLSEKIIRMNRREAIRVLGLAAASTLCGCSSLLDVLERQRLMQALEKPKDPEDPEAPNDLGEVHAERSNEKASFGPDQITDEFLADIRARSIYFDQDFPDDIRLGEKEARLVESLTRKLRSAQNWVGHGNFNVLGFDEFLRISASGAAGAVTAEEKDFLEKIFFTDAKIYGFQGQKVINRMSETFPSSSLVKVPYTGHFLRKGPALEIYNRIVKDVGDSLFLTSGIRGLVKQYHLFFEKCLATGGNISKASRSLAPPGYSFHGEGDFDIGKRGYGLRNFTEDFAATEEFKGLVGLGYIEIRYAEENHLGVRFEPWHIKVHSHA